MEYTKREEWVDSPGNEDKHYSGDIQPIEFITSCNFNFKLGNVIKYISRYPKKNGLEDIEKAQWYLNWQIRTHNNFYPNYLNGNITYAEYFNSQEFNTLQKKIIVEVYNYNFSGKLEYLCNAEQLTQELMEQCQE
jgi:hypothetical protein